MQLEGNEGGDEGREWTGQVVQVLVGLREDLGFPTLALREVGALKGWRQRDGT